MTLAEIRKRALFQAGEQESALGDMAQVVTQYINEGQQALCPRGIPCEEEVQVQNGVCALGEGVTGIVRLETADGREVLSYRMQNGVLSALADGRYRAMVLRETANLSRDGEESELPEACHGALADYAAWRLLSNGGRTQQLRGEFYRQRFMMEAARQEFRMENLMGSQKRINRYG